MNIEVKFGKPLHERSPEEIQRLGAALAAISKPLQTKILKDLGRYVGPPPGLVRSNFADFLKPLVAIGRSFTAWSQVEPWASPFDLPEPFDGDRPAEWEAKRKDGMLYFENKNNPAHVKVLSDQHGRKRWVELGAD